MEFTGLQEQLINLLALGYTKEEIIKIVETAPAIFRYTPKGIKMLIDTLEETRKQIQEENSSSRTC